MVGTTCPPYDFKVLEFRFLPPERRLGHPQAGGGLGEDCLSTQCEFRSPACLGLTEGTRRAANRGRLFFGYFLFGEAKESD